MGNKSAKKTNQLLGQQTNLANTAGDIYGARSEADYTGKGGLRDALIGERWKRYNEGVSGNGGAGGAGGGYLPYDYVSDVRMNEAMPTAREFMNTGGYTPEQIAQNKSFMTGATSGLYEGLKRDLATRAAGMGTPGAYTGSASRLARDKSYAMNESLAGANMQLENAIREGRFKGMGAVGGYDTEYMNRMNEARDKLEAAKARAAAAAASGNAEQAARANSELNSLTALLGSYDDLDWAKMQLSGYGQGLQGVTSRVDETPAWQKMATSLIPSAVSAGIGAFSNPYKKKSPSGSGGGYSIPNYGYVGE